MRLRVLGTLELLAEGSAGGFTAVVPLLSPKLRRLLAASRCTAGASSRPTGWRMSSGASSLRRTPTGRCTISSLACAPSSAGRRFGGGHPGTGLRPAGGRHRRGFNEFTHLVAQARPRLGGEPDRAAALLDAALALWRGPAYAEFADEEFARAEVNRLEELRVTAAEYRVDAALALGLPDEAVVRLEPLVRGHPLRERPHVQLVTALYRCGRHADALQVYRDFRQRLDDELGLQPSATFRRLEADVLRQDPGLTPPSPVPVRSVATPAAPAGARSRRLSPRRSRRLRARCAACRPIRLRSSVGRRRCRGCARCCTAPAW